MKSKLKNDSQHDVDDHLKMDDVLRRMLSTPPKSHKKPAKKQTKEAGK